MCSIIIFLFMIGGCSQKEMEYYSNPNMVSVNDLILHKTKIGDYQVFESESKLSIQGNGEPLRAGFRGRWWRRGAPL
ncbi:hypothetical protein [Peribacillus sp. NPDC096540]|uniref:hypothetical protein n=1 Tax=Peribacillus sp. NPDC096540 TaxID=3390612 RepID=UPI003D06FD3F